MHRAYAWIAAVAVVGCADRTLPGVGEHDPSQHMIIAGSAPDAPEHAAVVGLHQLQGGFVYTVPFCSGTLVAPDVVVTAAHCLDTAKGFRPTFQTMSADKVAVYVGDDPSVDLVANLHAVTETEIYPEFDRIALRGDLALLRLAAPVVGVVPVPVLPAAIGFTAADAGATVNLAGFGQTEDGTSGVKLQVDVPLAGLGCAVPAGCPDGGDPDTQVSYTQGTGGACYGDSGGPLFIERNGVVYLGGATSYGDVDCTIYGVSTRVDAFESYVAAFAGGDTGGGDTGASSCGDAVCDDGESCDGRNGTVSCIEDCPGKTNGRPTERFCTVGATCEGGGCP